MFQPAVPINEQKRLSSLKETNLLYTPPEAEFDNITKLASYICDTPVSLITLIGERKQWFKSKLGTDICDTDREISFCGHAILTPGELMEVPDTRLDERFKDNPFTMASKDPVLFYAGMPILDNEGMALGTLCVLDTKVKRLDEAQKEALKGLAQQVETLIELHRKNYYLEQIQSDLNIHNKLLKNFAGVVSHDIKMPLANMILTADILKSRYSQALGDEGMTYLKNLKQSGMHLNDYVNGILNHYESDILTKQHTEEFDLNLLLENIIDLLNITEDCEINLPEKNLVLTTNKAVLEQVYLNLLGNSLKYNNKKRIIINLDSSITHDYYIFSIEDNGIGIPASKQKDIFKLFKTLDVRDRNGNKGHGIGLSTVKKLVKSMGGNIEVTSEEGKGTKFTFSIRRNQVL